MLTDKQVMETFSVTESRHYQECQLLYQLSDLFYKCSQHGKSLFLLGRTLGIFLIK
jgi:hypothetical protein